MSRKVHITLVGGQRDPVLNGILFVQPDVVDFIYSPQTLKDAEIIKSSVEEIFKEEKIDKHIEYAKSEALSATDFNEIMQRAQKLVEEYADDEVWLSVTGGVKPWAIIIALVFEKHKNCTIFYINQNNEIWNFKTRESKKGQDIAFKPSRIGLHGSKVVHTDLKQYTEADDEAVQEIERLYKYVFLRPLFNAWFAASSNKIFEEVRKNKEGKIPCPKQFEKNNSGSYFKWKKYNKDGVPTTEIYISIIDKIGNIRSFTLDSPHAVELLFNSGWYEYKVAKILSGWSKAKEVWLNCRFLTQNNKDKNEVDIIIFTDSKPVFVECKTQIFSITDIDKFRTVVNNYGGSSSKALFATYENKHEDAKDKCADNHIIDLTIDSDSKAKRDALYEQLDKIYEEVNP